MSATAPARPTSGWWHGLHSAGFGHWVGQLYQQEMVRQGVLLDLSHAAFPPEVKAELFWDQYQRAQCNLLRKYLSRDLDAVVLGTGVGLTSCVLRRRQEPAQHLVVVEAHPALLEITLHNLKTNGLDDGVLPLGWAVAGRGRTRAELRMAVGAPITRAAVVPREERPQGLPVETVSLEQVLTEGHLDGDFTLVCDIGGAEVDLIRHDAGALAHCAAAFIDWQPGLAATALAGLEEHLQKQFGLYRTDAEGSCVYYRRKE